MTYRLFQLVVGLLLAYSITALADFPPHASLFHLTILTGSLVGGAYVVASERTDHHIRGLGFTYYGWLVLVGLALFEVVPPLLVSIAAALAIIPIALSVSRWTAIPTMWVIGMVTGQYWLAAVALGFWLMHRFSNITFAWANRGLYVVGAMLLIAQFTLFTPLALVAVPLAYMNYAAHSYRALWDRNQNKTLSGSWYVLGLILLIIGNGVMGTILSLPDVTRGDLLLKAQSLYVDFGIIAIVLGVINQAAAEMRGENRRVTGLMPFWLIAFGMLFAGTALSAAGLVEVYLTSLLSPAEVGQQTEPLLRGWQFGSGLMLLGMIIYALGFWARKVR